MSPVVGLARLRHETCRAASVRRCSIFSPGRAASAIRRPSSRAAWVVTVLVTVLLMVLVTVLVVLVTVRVTVLVTV